jgi:hypothetical protein
MQLISSAKSSQAKLKQELSSFLKGLDFSAAVPEVADDEEVVDESDSEEDVAEEEEEEEEEAAEESEEDEDVNMSVVEPVVEAKARPARQASPEIEGFVKKSGLSAIQNSKDSKDSSIFVSEFTSISYSSLWSNLPRPPEHTAGAVMV